MVTELDRIRLVSAIKTFGLSEASVTELTKVLEKHEEEVEDLTSRDVRSL